MLYSLVAVAVRSKCFNSGKTEFFLVGDDDSGPEDLKDDLDLECDSHIWLS
jgi:hypothetical protein